MRAGGVEFLDMATMAEPSLGRGRIARGGPAFNAGTHRHGIPMRCVHIWISCSHLWAHVRGRCVRAETGSRDEMGCRFCSGLVGNFQHGMHARAPTSGSRVPGRRERRARGGGGCACTFATGTEHQLTLSSLHPMVRLRHEYLPRCDESGGARGLFVPLSVGTCVIVWQESIVPIALCKAPGLLARRGWHG